MHCSEHIALARRPII